MTVYRGDRREGPSCTYVGDGQQQRRPTPASVGRTLLGEMSSPQPESAPTEPLVLPVVELLRRGRPHVPYGEQVIDDLTPEEADAFLDAVLS